MEKQRLLEERVSVGVPSPAVLPGPQVEGRGVPSLGSGGELTAVGPGRSVAAPAPETPLSPAPASVGGWDLHRVLAGPPSIKALPGRVWQLQHGVLLQHISWSFLPCAQLI